MWAVVRLLSIQSDNRHQLWWIWKVGGWHFTAGLSLSSSFGPLRPRSHSVFGSLKVSYLCWPCLGVGSLSALTLETCGYLMQLYLLLWVAGDHRVGGG